MHEVSKQQAILEQVLTQYHAVDAAQRRAQEIVTEQMNILQYRIGLLMLSMGTENMRMPDILEHQYKAALVTLKRSDLAVFEPSLEAVIGAFSPEQRQAFVTLQEPILVLVPQVPFIDKIRALNNNSLDYAPTSVAKIFGANVPSVSKKATTVQPVVIDGKQEMNASSTDNQGLILRERIAMARKKRLPHVQGIDREQYATLALHALCNSALLDYQTSTILDDDETLKGNIIPYARWCGCNVNFDKYRAGEAHETALFRSSVRGEVITM